MLPSVTSITACVQESIEIGENKGTVKYLHNSVDLILLFYMCIKLHLPTAALANAGFYNTGMLWGAKWWN